MLTGPERRAFQIPICTAIFQKHDFILLLYIKIHEWYFVVFHAMTNAICSDVVTVLLSPWIDLSDTLQSRYCRSSLLCYLVVMIDRQVPAPIPIKLWMEYWVTEVEDVILKSSGDSIAKTYPSTWLCSNSVSVLHHTLLKTIAESLQNLIWDNNLFPSSWKAIL